MEPRFVEVELTEAWMGHPKGTVHRLGIAMAKILIGRNSAKPKKSMEKPDKENEEKMETGKLDKMVRRSVRK